MLFTWYSGWPLWYNVRKMISFKYLHCIHFQYIGELVTTNTRLPIIYIVKYLTVSMYFKIIYQSTILFKIILFYSSHISILFFKYKNMLFFQIYIFSLSFCVHNCNINSFHANIRQILQINSIWFVYHMVQFISPTSHPLLYIICRGFI